MRREVGDTYPIWVKLNCADFMKEDSFTFEEKPEGLENVSNGETVTVKYTGTISEVDPFEGEVLSVEKTK